MPLEWISLVKRDVPAAGGTVSFTDIDDVRDPIECIAITQTGQNVTDEATLSEMLAGIGIISLKKGGSAIIEWDADDLFQYSMRRYQFKPPVIGGTADNHFRRLTLVVPCTLGNPVVRELNLDYGLLRGAKSMTLEVVTGSDTVAGIDNRNLQVACLVNPGAAPTNYLGHRQRTPSNIADSPTTIELGVSPDELLAEFFMYQTTNIDDGRTTDVMTIEDIRILRNKKEEIVRKIPTEVLQCFQDDTLLFDEYILVDIIPPLALDVPTDIEYTAGDNLATRVYPGILYKND